MMWKEEGASQLDELCIGIRFYRMLSHLMLQSSWLHHGRYIQVAGLLMHGNPPPRLLAAGAGVGMRGRVGNAPI